MNEELNPVQELCLAIVIQAAKDYREALKGKSVGRQPYYKTIGEVERFFRSEWFKALSDLDGEVLLNRLREEMKNEEVI